MRSIASFSFILTSASCDLFSDKMKSFIVLSLLCVTSFCVLHTEALNGKEARQQVNAPMNAKEQLDTVLSVIMARLGEIKAAELSARLAGVNIKQMGRRPLPG